MTNAKNQKILALIEGLKHDIEVANTHGLGHTARLLRIAILDLQTILFSISDDDLRYLTGTLEDGLENLKARRYSQ